MSKRTKIFIITVAIVAIFGFSCGSGIRMFARNIPNRLNRVEFEARIYNYAVQYGEINLDELMTDFEWDAMIILGPYHEPRKIFDEHSIRVGFPGIRDGICADHVCESVPAILVFLRNRAVVAYISQNYESEVAFGHTNGEIMDRENTKFTAVTYNNRIAMRHAHRDYIDD